MNRPAPLHPSLPRRPDRTSQREEPRHRVPLRLESDSKTTLERLIDVSPSRTFGETSIHAVRQISTTQDLRLCILTRVEGRVISRYHFNLQELSVLDLAIVHAFQRCGRRRGVSGKVPLGGTAIEVRFDGCAVLLRIVAANGGSHSHTRIEGAELEDLRLAIEDLKTRGATAALTKEK